MKLSTWNVNGIRASLNKGLREYLLESDADAREVTEKLHAMLSKTLACSDRPGACRME